VRAGLNLTCRGRMDHCAIIRCIKISGFLPVFVRFANSAAALKNFARHKMPARKFVVVRTSFTLVLTYKFLNAHFIVRIKYALARLRWCLISGNKLFVLDKLFSINALATARHPSALRYAETSLKFSTLAKRA